MHFAAKTNTTEKGGVSTGTIGNLIPCKVYRYKWFNPVTGEYSAEQSFTADIFGTYYLGEKNSSDMIIHIYC